MRVIASLLFSSLLFLSMDAHASALHGFSAKGQIDLRGVGSRKVVLHVREAKEIANDKLRTIYFGVLSIANSNGEFGTFVTIRFEKVSISKDGQTVHMYTRGRNRMGEGTTSYSISASLSDSGVLQGKLSSNQVRSDGELLEGEFQVNLRSA